MAPTLAIEAGAGTLPATRAWQRSRRFFALVVFALLFIAGGVLFGALTPAAAAGASTGTRLAPHRAVYEITLARAEHSSGIATLKGRMVYELSGSACKGFVQRLRMVLEMTDRDGKVTLSDIRSTNREPGDGSRYEFRIETYDNGRLNEETAGTARRGRDGKGVVVELMTPRMGPIELPGDVLFPIQHARAIIVAAKAGKRSLRANVYDGSEKGRKYFDTFTFIGRPYPATSAPTLPRARGAEALSGLASWPVAISYYEPAQEPDEGLPSYEMSFRYYANGVTRQLLTDYGNFAIRGALKQIELLPAPPCRGSP